MRSCTRFIHWGAHQQSSPSSFMMAGTRNIRITVASNSNAMSRPNARYFITTTLLMFLAFGSLVLPIKAALMSALTLGSTMGILTWMFVEDGHGSGLLNYTPQPLMAPMIGLIIAVIWGLSTDYEVFLVSRMVEARQQGMSTTEAIRIGTATTGRLITGAALVLAVVVAAFAFSDLVVMKYLAFGCLLYTSPSPRDRS